MKIKILSLAAMIGCSIVFSQEKNSTEYTPQISYGVKAGLNIALVPEVLEEVKENNSKPRFNAGLFVNYAFHPKWNVQAELEYSLKGSDAVFVLKDDNFPDGIDVHADFKLNYISLPLNIRWQFYDAFYLGTGVYVAYMVKDRVHVYTPDYVEDQWGFSIDFEGDLEYVAQKIDEQGYPLNVKINRWDFGLNLETGYVFKNNLGINVRYSQGLVNIIEGKDEDWNASPRNQVFFFGLDYRY